MNSLATSLLAAVQLGQATRLLQLETALSASTLLVERATLTEGLHAAEPLRAEVDCVSTEAGLPLKSLLGTRVALRLLLADGSWRTWQGWVAAVAQLGSDGGLGRYRLSVRDGSCWLAQRRDARIFQDLSTADIVAQVLQAWPQLPFRLEVAEPGPQRAITTQYRETDWAFACRLMAAEGWSWRLDHQATPEQGPQLVVFDQAAERPDLGGLRFSQPGRHGAAGSQLGPLVGDMVGDLFGGYAQDTLTTWSTHRSIGPNAVTLAAWDERQLAGVASQAQAAGLPAAVPPLEFYRGHGERRHASGRVADPLHASPSEAEAASQALLDAFAFRQQGVEAAGAVRALQPGATFGLLEHEVGGGDGGARPGHGPGGGPESRFTAIAITHEMANNLGARAAELLRATDVEQGSYRNRFSAAPAALRLLPWPGDFVQPTAAGPLSALVMAAGRGASAEPIHADRDGRVRIQFAWQRGEHPLPGGLPGPLTPAGEPTGHAPGDATSGSWVRVAQSMAGPDWGALFTPRAGTEVLVDFIDGDIDRPLIVGQLHNGPHALPWPAGVDSGANHPGTISGWHHPHLQAPGRQAGPGANQWLIDDATGQLRMRLASHSSATGHSELTLGHLIQQSAWGGPGAAQRGAWLGEGFCGHTEGWAVVRAGEGLLLSTAARPAQGTSVSSTQMDASEAVGQLKAAQQLGDTLAQSARQQGAHGLHSHEPDQAWAQHTEAMDPAAQGRYTGAVGGQDARQARAGSRELAEPVERFAKPLLHLDTPASAVWVTPASIHLFSGQDHSVSAQGDVHLSAAHTVSAVSGQTTSLYTHAGGIQAITANAALSVRAHTDAQQVWSEQDLTVQSTTDEVRVQASKSITLTAGQSQIVIEGADITFSCPGSWTVKAGSHDWLGAGSEATSPLMLPSGVQQIEAVSSLLEQAHGRTVSLEEVPIEWLPHSIAHRVKGLRKGESLAEVGVTPADVFSEPLMLDQPADMQLKLLHSSAWQVSEAVRQPLDESPSHEDDWSAQDASS
jgi:type VI secretion system secreted protein VgrG